jgi:nucleolar MIF4G domain-containing protein 1
MSLPQDYAELMAEMQDSEDDSEGEDDDDSEGDSEDEEMEEYGASDEELFNPADDDDHDEMGEIGSEDSGSEQMLDDGSEEESEEEEPVVKAKGAKQVTFESPAGPIATPAAAAPGRYVPPHLRQAAIEPVSKPSDKMDAPPDDPRLRRQILGLLNKLSSLNMPTIIASLEAFYLSHPRATVSTILTSLILEIISGRDNLGEAFIISYAALVAAMSKSVGIELPAGVIRKCIVMFDDARAKASIPLKEGEVEVGFEGRPGSKECENLVGFLAELYNFQVIACVLVYDLVKLFIDSGLGELDVELLVKIVRRECSVPSFL